MRNELKWKLKAGERSIGIWITIESPIVSELLSGLGFDWFVFDLEHSPLDVYTVQTMMQAMKGKTTPIIRVAWNDPVLIKRALDVGAYGVVVPWVDCKEDAIKAVKACRYPPIGIRGCGARRPAMFDDDYYEVADEEILLVTQVETKEAVNRVEDISSVEGVDVLFVGPFDLAASYGCIGRPEAPIVQKAISRVLEASEAVGIAAGIYMGGGKTPKIRFDEGFQFIAIEGDLGLLRLGAKEVLSPFEA